MSTADSRLLMASSALTEDILKPVPDEHRQNMLLQIGRVAVIVITLFATLPALNPDNNILQLVACAWAGFGVAFGPIILLSLYWKSLNGRAAPVGIVTGGITVVIGKNIPNTHVFLV